MIGTVFLQQIKSTAYLRRLKFLCCRLRFVDRDICQKNRPSVASLEDDILLTCLPPVDSAVVIVKFLQFLEFTHFLARLGEVPEFAAYAIADGIRRAFTRFGKWVRTAAKAIAEKPETETAQLLPGFAELFDTDDG